MNQQQQDLMVDLVAHRISKTGFLSLYLIVGKSLKTTCAVSSKPPLKLKVLTVWSAC